MLRTCLEESLTRLLTSLLTSLLTDLQTKSLSRLLNRFFFVWVTNNVLTRSVTDLNCCRCFVFTKKKTRADC